MSLLTWLRRRFRKRPPSSGQLHLFVRHKGRVGYGGIVADKEEGRDRAETFMAEECMRTGEMVLANYWTTHESELNKAERELVQLAGEKSA